MNLSSLNIAANLAASKPNLGMNLNQFPDPVDFSASTKMLDDALFNITRKDDRLRQEELQRQQVENELWQNNLNKSLRPEQELIAKLGLQKDRMSLEEYLAGAEGRKADAEMKRKIQEENLKLFKSLLQNELNKNSNIPTPTLTSNNSVNKNIATSSTPSKEVSKIITPELMAAFNTAFNDIVKEHGDENFAREQAARELLANFANVDRRKNLTKADYEALNDFAVNNNVSTLVDSMYSYGGKDYNDFYIQTK